VTTRIIIIIISICSYYLLKNIYYVSLKIWYLAMSAFCNHTQLTTWTCPYASFSLHLKDAFIPYGSLQVVLQESGLYLRCSDFQCLYWSALPYLFFPCFLVLSASIRRLYLWCICNISFSFSSFRQTYGFVAHSVEGANLFSCFL
jgi:hypothetical protein